MLTPEQHHQLTKIQHYVAKKLAHDFSGHDINHINRVVTLSKIILKEEPLADEFIVLASAYLHDVIDDKITDNSVQESEQLKSFLTDLALSKSQITSIFSIIESMSYRKNLEQKITLSLEGQIVQDADRLDAIGAIGIARTFYYGGNKKHIMYDPDMIAREKLSEEEYKKSNTVINHFYEKLLHLKDQMNTEKAKELALHRHHIMEQFIDDFKAEWNLKS